MALAPGGAGAGCRSTRRCIALAWERRRVLGQRAAADAVRPGPHINRAVLRPWGHSRVYPIANPPELGMLMLSMTMRDLSAEPATGPTIVVVDDDLPFLRAAVELLTDRGFHVVGHATSAHDAVDECRRLSPDGVLLDVRLGDGHGVTVAETLRLVPDPPTIVLISSDPAAVSPEQLRASGASGFIPKSKLAHSDLEALFNGEGA